MSRLADRLRSIMSAPGHAEVAPVFDPLSARIADAMGWQIGKLPGSTAKMANLGLPDGLMLAGPSDLVEVCRRIGQVADLGLVVDADDGGTPLQVRRTVRELEGVGVAGIEIDDLIEPQHFGDPAVLTPLKDQLAKLDAALAARRDPATVIIGRTSALAHCPLDAVLERVAAYASNGADAVMLPGLRGDGLSGDPRQSIEAVHEACAVPLLVSGLPWELTRDTEWLHQQGVKLVLHGHHAYRMAVRAVHDALAHLAAGRDPRELLARHAEPDLLKAVVGLDELVAWDEKYSPGVYPRGADTRATEV